MRCQLLGKSVIFMRDALTDGTNTSRRNPPIHTTRDGLDALRLDHKSCEDGKGRVASRDSERLKVGLHSGRGLRILQHGNGRLCFPESGTDAPGLIALGLIAHEHAIQERSVVSDKGLPLDAAHGPRQGEITRMDRLSGWRFSDTAVLRNTTYQELNMLNHSFGYRISFTTNYLGRTI